MLRDIAKVLSGECKIIVSSENEYFYSDGIAIYDNDREYLYCIFDKTITEYTIPATLIDIDFHIGFLSDSLPLFEKFYVDEDNLYFSAVDGVLYDYDKTRVIAASQKCFDKTIIIPDGVIHINDYAYATCRDVTDIIIPNTVIDIGYFVFYLPYPLTFENVYYQGTKAEWDAIKIGNNNTELTEATIRYYSETEPPLNDDGTDYVGNYWHYVEGVPTAWVYADNE